ncbi:MAG: hypothetical protein MI861_02985, partial [Pirellulales bacterium]|nr:hypothetical protein [Pirellulales bacterium]
MQLYAGMAADDLCEGVSESNRSKALDNVRKIASAVRGMSGIVNDVLSFSCGMEPSCVELDASQLLDRVVAAHAPGIDQASVHVVRRDLVEPAVKLSADAGLVQQA